MSDLIRRRDAIDAISKAHFKNYGNAIMVIQDLPSAEPERKWIPVSERLPEEGRLVIVSGRSEGIGIASLIKGISQETRRKMENGEIDNPDVEGWCQSDGWTKSKRSNIFQEGDEWGNNSKDYAWQYGPYHYFGQEFIAWMPLPEPWGGE